MAVSDAVRGALKKGKISQKELAKRWGKLPQAINNKLRQYSWTGEELAGIAEMTGGKLAFVYPDGAEIPVEAGPTKAGKAVRAKKPQTVQKTALHTTQTAQKTAVHNAASTQKTIMHNAAPMQRAAMHNAAAMQRATMHNAATMQRSAAHSSHSAQNAAAQSARAAQKAAPRPVRRR